MAKESFRMHGNILSRWEFWSLTQVSQIGGKKAAIPHPTAADNLRTPSLNGKAPVLGSQQTIPKMTNPNLFARRGCVNVPLLQEENDSLPDRFHGPFQMLGRCKFPNSFNKKRGRESARQLYGFNDNERENKEIGDPKCHPD